MSADATLAQFSNTFNVGLILHSFVQQWPRSEVPYVAAGFRNVHIAKHRTLPERPQINYSILRKIYFRHAWLQLSSRRELTVALGIIRVHILIQWIILPCTFCNVPSFRSASNYFIGKFSDGNPLHIYISSWRATTRHTNSFIIIYFRIRKASLRRTIQSTPLQACGSSHENTYTFYAYRCITQPTPEPATSFTFVGKLFK